MSYSNVRSIAYSTAISEENMISIFGYICNKNKITNIPQITTAYDTELFFVCLLFYVRRLTLLEYIAPFFNRVSCTIAGGKNRQIPTCFNQTPPWSLWLNAPKVLWLIKPEDSTTAASAMCTAYSCQNGITQREVSHYLQVPASFAHSRISRQYSMPYTSTVLKRSQPSRNLDLFLRTNSVAEQICHVSS
jgi:hypothetical protein